MHKLMKEVHDPILEIVNKFIKISISNDNQFVVPFLVNIEVDPIHNVLYSDLPYHNKEHCERVASLALHLFINNGTFTSNTTEPGTELLIAGLLHDANHTGGKQEDWENILLAKKVAYDLLFINPFKLSLLKKVNSLISSTQFPPVEEPETFLHQCLVDADLLATTLLKNSVDVLVDGLLEEWNNSRTNDNKISLESFYEQQALFHSNLKHVLKTPIALFLLEKYGEQTLIDLKERVGL